MRLALALLLPLLAAAPALAVPPAPAAHYDHAYAVPTCAPWDGGAWAIHLQGVPPGPVVGDRAPAPAFPSYGCTVWMRQPPVGRWLAFDQQWQGQAIGNVFERRSAAASRVTAGRIRFDRADDQGFAGELRVARPGGGELALPFVAPKIKQRVFCG